MAIIKRAKVIEWIKNPENQGKNFEIRFKKVDGSIRTMRCQTGVNDGTLNANRSKRAKAEGVIGVYDTDTKAYRSFREDSLLSVNVDDNGWMDVEEARIVPLERMDP